MVQAPAQPKYHRIRQQLQQEIADGRWQPGDRLPPVRDLAVVHGVTAVTIGRALADLEADGVVRREHGVGTFVCDTQARLLSGVVGVGMGTQGHLFGPLFGALMKALGAHGIDALPSPMEVGQTVPAAERERGLSRFLGADVRAVLLDGDVFFPFSWLNAHSGRLPALTFFYRCETPLSFPQANRVLCNFRLGGNLAARHLLDCGVRTFAAVSVGAHVVERCPAASQKTTAHCHWQQGVEDALHEAGLSPQEHLTVVHPGIRAAEHLLEAAIRRGVTGVLCLRDVDAVQVYRTADRLGLIVGRDLYVVGNYDTPWAAQLTPTLTSVNIQEVRMAERVVQAVVEGWTGERCWIPPVLVPRESTGGTPPPGESAV